MKRIAIILAVSVLMPAATAVFAADTASYDETNNKVTVGDNISNYSTVLITKDDDSSIAYLNQATSVFATSMEFMQKDGSADGDYTIKLGNASGETKEITFTIASTQPEQPAEEVEMEQLNGSESL